MSPPESGHHQEAVSSRALAALARAGFSVSREPSMQVAFEVHHVKDRPGFLRDLLQGKLSSTPSDGRTAPPRFIETLSTSAHGVGLVVGTRTLSTGPDQRGVAYPEIQTPDHAEGRASTFRGTATPNVSFTYDSADATHEFEGLISVENEPRPLQLRHGRAIRAVMSKVAEVAVHIADAPILSLQAPVQLPTHDYADPGGVGRAVHWPRSSALAVRFTLSLNKPSAELRLKLADALAEFCADNGFGLSLADTRLGYRSGNWFRICRHDKKVVRRRFNGSLDSPGASRAYSCLPVTFVGPARVGSTYAILRFLSNYPELGILACSGTTINDIAFTHLQLTVNAVANARVEALNEVLNEDVHCGLDTPLLLRRVLDRIAKRSGGGAADVSRLEEKAGDYQMLVGPALPVNADVGEGRKPLWVSWEVEGHTADLNLPFLALHDALQDLPFFGDAHGAWDLSSPHPNVEYLISRRVRNAVLRGKGKLSLPARAASKMLRHPDDLQRALSMLSDIVESAWRARLDGIHHVRELTVSWREYWLGHWTSPLD